ncbi:MAG: DUF1328 domain-containing protein [Pseudomonadota bacterium]
MVYWVLLLFVVVTLSGVVGFAGAASATAYVAQGLFYVSAALLAGAVVAQLHRILLRRRRRRSARPKGAKRYG